MASVTSLDKDLRRLRLEKFTPAAANEVRVWIEETLGEKLPSSDVLEALKDGTALCKLVNLALPPPGVKFKKSAMPFVQMENISHFLRSCQSPPLNLQQHDMFLTVDLFEQKDPAQVLQCLVAFSRAANAANPGKFPNVIGAKSRSGALTPQETGQNLAAPAVIRGRGNSVASNGSSTYGATRSLVPHKTGDSGSGRSVTKSPTNAPTSPSHVSSWSRKQHEGVTSPAWNIAQYGYMGGASQGNLGISFGGRRQITSSGPSVPSLADKQRLRKEQEAEGLRQQEESERKRKVELEAEEQARIKEEQRWTAETERERERERQKADEEKRKWEEEERQWRLTEAKRRRDEKEAERRLEEERKQRARDRSSSRPRAQLRQGSYDRASVPGTETSEEDGYRSRVRELEKELELARQREASYERERQTRITDQAKARTRSRSRPAAASPPMRNDSFRPGEREVLRTKWARQQSQEPEPERLKTPPLVRSPRPLPDPTMTPRSNVNKTPVTSPRPLPDPAMYASPPQQRNRTDRFLAQNPTPAPVAPRQIYSRELGATAERDAEDQRRAQSQEQTKAGNRASKSLLEREMELERQRQREWEEAQEKTTAAVPNKDGVDGIGGGIGGRWDVSQWSGFVGGDNQNNGTQGIGASRRPGVGHRPLPPEPR